MSTNSPYMGLTISTIGTDTGLQWEQNLNLSLTTIDNHNHASGSGVQITPSGFNINADLPFNSFNATLLRSTRYVSQAAALALGTDLGCISNIAGNLYWNNNAGTAVQITSGSSIVGAAGTITGLPSGTASAAFSSSTFVFNAATLTPANIQGGSLLLGNNISSSNYLTLAPPNAMASSFGLVLPSVPAANSFLTLDTSGNITGSINVSAGLTHSNLSASAGILGSQLSGSAGILGSQIANTTITAGNIVANTITAGQIANNTITAGQIASGTITGAQLGTNIGLPGKSPSSAGNILVVANTNSVAGTSLGIIRISFNSGGTITAGEGATCVANGSGLYTVTYGTTYADPAVIMVMATDTSAGLGVGVNYMLAGSCQFSFGDATNHSFNFIAMGSRS